MFKVNDHKTGRLFDPIGYLEPKRCKLLKTSWAGVFRKYLLNKLPVKKLNTLTNIPSPDQRYIHINECPHITAVAQFK